MLKLLFLLLFSSALFAAEQIAVVGGGLAGLTAAYRLSQAGKDVTLYEASDRVGGQIATVQGVRLGGQEVTGAHLATLAQELRVPISPGFAKHSTEYVLRDGIAVPHSNSMWRRDRDAPLIEIWALLERLKERQKIVYNSRVTGISRTRDGRFQLLFDRADPVYVDRVVWATPDMPDTVAGVVRIELRTTMDESVSAAERAVKNLIYPHKT